MITSPVTTPVIELEPTIPAAQTISGRLTKPLERHMIDPQVRILQQLLNQRGHTVAKTGEGSPGNEAEFFGHQTEIAVKAFQAANGLEVDGVVGPAVRALLNGDAAPVVPTEPVVSTPEPVVTLATKLTTPLQRGITHPEVKLLQQILNTNGYTVAESGEGSSGNEGTFFGAQTEAAVRAFQADYDLEVDGVVGPSVRSLVNSLLE